MNHSDELERLAAQHNRSPLDVLELFLERAAIREHDGRMSRAEAERLAVGDVADVLSRQPAVRRNAPRDLADKETACP